MRIRPHHSRCWAYYWKISTSEMRHAVTVIAVACEYAQPELQPSCPTLNDLYIQCSRHVIFVLECGNSFMLCSGVCVWRRALWCIRVKLAFPELFVFWARAMNPTLYLIKKDEPPASNRGQELNNSCHDRVFRQEFVHKLWFPHTQNQPASYERDSSTTNE
jgi:hypothetical protein